MDKEQHCDSLEQRLGENKGTKREREKDETTSTTFHRYEQSKMEFTTFHFHHNLQMGSVSYSVCP